MIGRSGDMMIKEVRLIPNNKVSCVLNSTHDPSQKRTHKVIYKEREASQSVNDLVNALRCSPSHIEGNGNGSISIVGCE